MEKISVVDNKKEVSQARKAIATLWLFLGIMFIPSIAFANPIADGVDWLLDLLTNGIARSVAIIAIVILGYMAWAGRVTGEAAIKFIGGIVLVFGGAGIVDLIIAAVSKA